MGSVRLLLGDCVDVMSVLDANSIDAIVTDPPYGLSFMGKAWDGPQGMLGQLATGEERRGAFAYGGSHSRGYKDNVPAVFYEWCLRWATEALRVAKPGAHMLAFGGTRTFHRLACAIEDAGWEIRDTVMWVYGSGFPKSLDVSKAIDKAAGLLQNEGQGFTVAGYSHKPDKLLHTAPSRGYVPPRPQSPDAERWQGWGTALKPAWEPIILARKPLQGTVAANVLEWGTGALNIDATRIPTGDATSRHFDASVYEGPGGYRTVRTTPTTTGGSTLGRWPSNFIHDGSEEVLALMPSVKAGVAVRRNVGHSPSGNINYATGSRDSEMREDVTYADSGSAARFFYCAKSSRADRNSGLDCTSTVKYDVPVGGASCRDVTMALVESLRKAMSESTVTWHIGESGVSIMGRCPSDTLSTTLTAISRITTSAILNSLTPSLISAFTQDANLGAANGGSRAGSVASSSQYPPTTTLARLAESAPGARLVASQMLSQISDAANWKPATNTHSTVKPTALMRYLCRLVTPPGGVVLDPFMGSGSTGKAAVMEGFDFMGIEVEPEYYALAEARIAHAQEQHTPQLEFAL